MKMTEERIRDSVFALWMQTGVPVLPREIAAHLQCSLSTVNKVLNAHGGAVAGTVSTRRTIAVREKSYGTIRAHRQVWALEPDKSYLRQMLLKRGRALALANSQRIAEAKTTP